MKRFVRTQRKRALKLDTAGFSIKKTNGANFMSSVLKYVKDWILPPTIGERGVEYKGRKFIKDWILPPKVSRLILGYVYKVKSFSFESRRLFKRNMSLKDRHKGQRCFILGAGPSVNEQDLKKLKGEYVVSVSCTYLHRDFAYFHPQYHVLPRLFSIVKQHPSGVSQGIEWLKQMENAVDAEMFFHIADKEVIERNGLFKNRIIYWNDYYPWDEESPIRKIDLSSIPEIWSVSEYALCLAVYMGFEKIYMLGFDHDWYNGPIVHFFDEKEHKLQLADMYSFLDSEFQMRRHAYIFRKYKMLYALHKGIFNANANTKTYVDVFPKVKYDSLFPGR